jgi:hypothetical protein
MRISLSASAANAAPGSKVETAMSAANARRESVDMSGSPQKKRLLFQLVGISGQPENSHRGNRRIGTALPKPPPMQHGATVAAQVP